MDERELILQLKNCDGSAFRELVQLFQHRVYYTMLSIIQSPSDAEDICQEVFIEVYRSVGQFKGDARMSTWMYRIASNKALEFLSRKKTQERFAFVRSLFGQMTNWRFSRVILSILVWSWRTKNADRHSLQPLTNYLIISG